MTSVIRFNRLTCGMPVCVQTSNESRLLSVSIWIKAGSIHDPAGKDGLAHLCEHLLLRPLAHSNTRTYKLLHKAGVLVNAYTDAEWIVISAQAGSEQAASLIELLSLLLYSTGDSADDLEQEKKVIQREFRLSEPGYPERVAGIFRETAFTPPPRVQPDSTTAVTLAAIETSDIQGFYSQFLTGANIMITVHGNVNVEYLIGILDRAFDTFPKIPRVSNFETGEPLDDAQPVPAYNPVMKCPGEMRTGGSSDICVLAGINSVPRLNEAYWTALAFEVLMADGPGSLLFQWFRGLHSWSYGAISMTEAFSSWGCQYFLMNISSNSIDEALEQMGSQWQALPKQLTDERMEALRNRFVCRALSSLSGHNERMILLRDLLLGEPDLKQSLDGGVETFVYNHVQNVSQDRLLDYIQRYAEWEKVSLVCVPMP